MQAKKICMQRDARDTCNRPCLHKACERVVMIMSNYLTVCFSALSSGTSKIFTHPNLLTFNMFSQIAKNCYFCN